MIGTPGFITPEILMQEQYDISADVSYFAHAMDVQCWNYYVDPLEQESET